MGLSFLTPLFLAGLLVVAVPVIVHLIRRHRGEPLPFPSLMFLRQLPVRSVRRRKIRDWPLLLVRVAALALIAFAFARPVLQAGAAGDDPEGDAFREVVVVLDRSWSMALGERWERAQAAVGDVLDGLVPPDRVSLVVFDGVGRVVVEPTLDPGRIRAALDTLRPGWGATRIGVGLQAASGILEASERTRPEVVLVSDFQRRGWEDGPREPLPAGTALTPVDVGGDGTGLVTVTEVSLQHSFVEGRQRVHPAARVVRLGEGTPERVRVTLELDGRETEARDIELEEEGALSVSFDPFILPPEGIRGAVRVNASPAGIGGAGGATTPPFRFVVSPREILSVLVLNGAGREEGLYLERALTVGGGAPVRVDARSGSGFTASDLGDANLVILNDTPLPSGATGELLREHLARDGGLVIVAGPRSGPGSWEGAWDALLPGRPGAPVDRNPARGGRLSQVDRDHPVFTPFAAEGGRGLGAPRFFRYRSLSVPEGAGEGGGEGGAGTRQGGAEEGGSEREEGAVRVLARFDDGAPALAERTSGRGRVLLWTSSLDTLWTNLPLQGVFVPLVQEMARYAAGRREAVPYYTVGQPLEARFLLERAGLEEEGDGRAMLVDPGGRGTELRTDAGVLPPELATPGFYDVRVGDREGRVVWTFAVNPDPGEADPARIDPEELALAATSRLGPDAAGEEGEETATAAERAGAGLVSLSERERRQGAWRFLLLGALLLLAGETLLANRRRRGAEGGRE